MVEKLNTPKYQMQEKQYMAFGSICNMCQRIITPANKQEIVDWAWQNAREKTKKMIGELYNDEMPKSQSGTPAKTKEEQEPELPILEI